jgi:hypothetical protein
MEEGIPALVPGSIWNADIARQGPEIAAFTRKFSLFFSRLPENPEIAS